MQCIIYGQSARQRIPYIMYIGLENAAQAQCLSCNRLVTTEDVEGLLATRGVGDANCTAAAHLVTLSAVQSCDGLLLPLLRSGCLLLNRGLLDGCLRLLLRNLGATRDGCSLLLGLVATEDVKGLATARRVGDLHGTAVADLVALSAVKCTLALGVAVVDVLVVAEERHS